MIKNTESINYISDIVNKSFTELFNNLVNELIVSSDEDLKLNTLDILFSITYNETVLEELFNYNTNNYNGCDVIRYKDILNLTIVPVLIKCLSIIKDNNKSSIEIINCLGCRSIYYFSPIYDVTKKLLDNKDKNLVDKYSNELIHAIISTDFEKIINTRSKLYDYEVYLKYVLHKNSKVLSEIKYKNIYKHLYNYIDDINSTIHNTLCTSNTDI